MKKLMCWLVIGAALTMGDRTGADTHLQYTGSFNGVSLDQLGGYKDVWLSPTAARWNEGNVTTIINYSIGRVLLIFHDQRSYVETVIPFDPAQVLPPLVRILYSARDFPFEVSEATPEGPCSEGTQVTTFEDGRDQILCLVDSLPGVDMTKLRDLQRITFSVVAAEAAWVEELLTHGAIVRIIGELKLGYQKTRISIELDSIDEEEPPWNLYGIPLGYKRIDQVDWENTSDLFAGSAFAGATGLVSPSFLRSEGNRLQVRAGHRGPITAVHYAEGDRLAVTGGADGSVRLWDLANGRELLAYFGHTGAVTAIATLGGIMAATGDSEGGLRIWSLQSGEQQAGRDFLRGITAFDWRLDLERMLVATDSRVAVAQALPRCDTASVLAGEGCNEVEPNPRKHLKFLGETPFTRILANSDGDLLATGTKGGVTTLWSEEDGREIWRRQGATGVADLAFSAEAGLLAVADEGGSLEVWRTSGEALVRFDAHRDGATAVRFIGEERLASAGRDGQVRIWKLPEGDEVGAFEVPGGALLALDVSENGEFALAGSESGAAHHLRVATGEVVQTLRGELVAATAIQIAASELHLAVEYGSLGTVVWNLREGGRERMVTEPEPPAGRVPAPAPGWMEELWAQGESIPVRRPSADGELVLVGTAKGRIGVFGAESGLSKVEIDREAGAIVDLALSRDRSLLASASADGWVELWDAEYGEQIARLAQFVDGSWLVVDPDGRFDSDQPGHLPGVAWILASQPLETYPLEIFVRDYFTPGLLARLVAAIELPETPRLESRNLLRPRVQIVEVVPSNDDPARVDVLVEVEQHVLDPRLGVASGAEDLRLFRDGRLVATFPRQGGEINPSSTRTQLHFDHIQLPRRAAADSVSFEAYAFNSDRLKSETSSWDHPLPRGLQPRRGTAYLIHAGVSNYRDDALDLSFAAADARLFGSVLERVLTESDDYDEVVSLVLVSEATGEPSMVDKRHLRAALERLAGQQSEIVLPAAEHLRLALPEDLVVISLAGHGVVDRNGIFYFLPADFDGVRGTDLAEWDLSGAISSTELGRWLQDLDGAEIVLIVDACYSAASIDAEGFRPGPMGSRGLGELAYNKGMRVLTAAGSDAVAVESDSIRHGLLTYALVQEGLAEARADFAPVDGSIYLAEWLHYAVARVPELYRRTSGERGVELLKAAPIPSQVPRVFDFAPAGPGPVLRHDLSQSQ